MIKMSLYYTLRSIQRELIRGHFFRSFHYKKIRKNEFTKESLELYQNQRLKKIIKSYAVNNIKYEKIYDFILNFPIISKLDVKNNPKKYESKKCRKIFTNYNKTTGTTGSPLKIKQSLECCQIEEAFTYRQRKWAGYSIGDRHAWIRGDLIVPTRKTEPPYWCRDYFMNKLIMSSYHISSATSIKYIEELQRFDPVLIEAYPSSISALAKWLESENRVFKGKSLKGIMTSSEVLTDEMKKLIEEQFGCQVYDWYGQSERVAAIGTCEKGSRHLLIDYSFVEVDDNNNGEIIGTSFNNVVMPLMRYRTGDYIKMSSEPCECGRIYPVVKKIYGRENKPIILSDGRKILFLDQVFRGITGLIESQIVQKTFEIFVVKIVTGTNFEEKSKKVIMENLRERLGDVSIRIEICENIPRGKNGKYEFLKVENNEEK